MLLRPKAIALTGPTGSGKSTVASWLAARGAAVIDADRVGHEVLRMPPVRAAVVQRFTDAVLAADGEIDRSKLGKLVFPDAAQLAALEAISHPHLLAELAARIETLQSTRVATMVVVDAALWFRWEQRPAVDLVIGVRAPLADRIARIRGRDQIDEATAMHRVQRQPDLEASLELADAVLDTADDIGKSRMRLLELLDEKLGLDLVATDPA